MREDVFGPAYTREPQYDVAVQDVMIPLRDGVRLATTLFFPARDGNPLPGKWPVVFERTPYDRTSLHDRALYYARRGYVAANQDVRGRYGSEGSFYAFAHEGPDGYDAVEWLAAQDWCDGKVGTLGQSYDAAVQSALASLNPPHLKAMVVSYGPASYYHSSMRHNGALEQRFVTYAFNMAATSREAAADPALKAEAEAACRDIWRWLRPGAVLRGQTPLHLFPSYEDWCIDLLTRSVYDDYWRQPGYGPRPYVGVHADVPTLYVGGWYDTYTRGTLENYMAFSACQKTPVHVLMGPWHHGGAGVGIAGDAAFEPQGSLDYEGLRLQWFDHFLLGLPTGLERTPPVKYFLMGGGRGLQQDTRTVDVGGQWCGADTWPPPEATPTPFYLHANGTLSTQPPTQDQSCTRYTFDPSDPVPTIGGQLSAIDIPPGAFDQRNDPRFPFARGDAPLSERADVLVFQTEPLAEAVTLAGPVTARLWVSTDGPDTDFTAKLVDVHPPAPAHPEGCALNLTDSIQRLRFRNGYEREELAVPGEVYCIEFELYPTANRFLPGHRIRVDISSSNYPRFDVNTNTGGPLGLETATRVAHNTLHHDRAHPSQVILPVMEG
jgi:putative CocE/NonD family hydrolase